MTKNMQKDIIKYAENKYCKSPQRNIANHSVVYCFIMAMYCTVQDISN